MNTNHKLLRTDDNKDYSICNALGCNEIAIHEVSLKIQDKSISIVVCDGCKNKFE